MRLTITALFIFFCYFLSQAQSDYYWVYFKKNKSKTVDFNLKYLNKIKSENIEIIGTSKWFNAAFVKINDKKILNKIYRLKQVNKVEKSHHYTINKNSINNDTSEFVYTRKQLSMLGLDKFHNKGFTGKNITLAVFDAGFYKADSLLAFDSLRKRNGILATKDFVENNSNVYNDDTHGMYVLSTIGGFIKDSLMGAAIGVDFLLARTEDVSSEKHLEEFNWIKALEWADSIGVDIIHSSLGYSVFDTLQGDYTYNDMDGESTIITRAAQMAFKRGIFITNSAGNEGAKKWRYITAPCDGRDVLCVGAVDANMIKSGFSSFGPSADGRVKPDVMAMGSDVTIGGTNNIIRTGSGTSFSGPLIAGFVACLKQKFPSVSNKIILDAIRKSGSRYNNPNDSMGYGIPNANRADSLILIKLGYNFQSLKKSEISISPNPFSNYFEVKCKSKIKSVEIFDIYGKSLMNTEFSEMINTDKLFPDTYIVKITDINGFTYFSKIIKN